MEMLNSTFIVLVLHLLKLILPKDKKQSKKASIRKGRRSTPGEPIMNNIESENDEDEK